MGQKPSSNPSPTINFLGGNKTTKNPNPQQPIKFQYTRKNKELSHNNNKPIRTKSEPILTTQILKDKIISNNHHHHHRPKHHRSRKISKPVKNQQQFGYEIQDIDAFLTKATIDKPANIPVVLSFPTILYQTRIGGYQSEISLPLGMVVNAIFKNQTWLYVQTPHAEEGYVNYTSCLPLGIINNENVDYSPCWESCTDVFPKPLGNMTDTEKLSTSDLSSVRNRRYWRNSSSNSSQTSCGEKSVDKLYLRASAKRNRISNKRQTLVVVVSDFVSANDNNKNILNVKQGDVVVLLDSKSVPGWFWVRNNEGAEGFIPAATAGHGFL